MHLCSSKDSSPCYSNNGKEEILRIVMPRDFSASFKKDASPEIKQTEQMVAYRRFGLGEESSEIPAESEDLHVFNDAIVSRISLEKRLTRWYKMPHDDLGGSPRDKAFEYRVLPSNLQSSSLYNKTDGMMQATRTQNEEDHSKPRVIRFSRRKRALWLDKEYWRRFERRRVPKKIMTPSGNGREILMHRMIPNVLMESPHPVPTTTMQLDSSSAPAKAKLSLEEEKELKLLEDYYVTVEEDTHNWSRGGDGAAAGGGATGVSADGFRRRRGGGGRDHRNDGIPLRSWTCFPDDINEKLEAARKAGVKRVILPIKSYDYYCCKPIHDLPPVSYSSPSQRMGQDKQAPLVDDGYHIHDDKFQSSRNKEKEAYTNTDDRFGCDDWKDLAWLLGDRRRRKIMPGFLASNINNDTAFYDNRSCRNGSTSNTKSQRRVESEEEELMRRTAGRNETTPPRYRHITQRDIIDCSKLLIIEGGGQDDYSQEDREEKEDIESAAAAAAAAAAADKECAEGSSGVHVINGSSRGVATGKGGQQQQQQQYKVSSTPSASKARRRSNRWFRWLHTSSDRFDTMRREVEHMLANEEGEEKEASERRKEREMLLGRILDKENKTREGGGIGREWLRVRVVLGFDLSTEKIQCFRIVTRTTTASTTMMGNNNADYQQSNREAWHRNSIVKLESYAQRIRSVPTKRRDDATIHDPFLNATAIFPRQSYPSLWFRRFGRSEKEEKHLWMGVNALLFGHWAVALRNFDIVVSIHDPYNIKYRYYRMLAMHQCYMHADVIREAGIARRLIDMTHIDADPLASSPYAMKNMAPPGHKTWEDFHKRFERQRRMLIRRLSLNTGGGGGGGGSKGGKGSGIKRKLGSTGRSNAKTAVGDTEMMPVGKNNEMFLYTYDERCEEEQQRQQQHGQRGDSAFIDDAFNDQGRECGGGVVFDESLRFGLQDTFAAADEQREKEMKKETFAMPQLPPLMRWESTHCLEEEHNKIIEVLRPYLHMMTVISRKLPKEKREIEQNLCINARHAGTFMLPLGITGHGLNKRILQIPTSTDGLRKAFTTAKSQRIVVPLQRRKSTAFLGASLDNDNDNEEEDEEENDRYGFNNNRTAQLAARKLQKDISKKIKTKEDEGLYTKKEEYIRQDPFDEDGR
eukprot:jgi/Bigna1/76088/fgenesh1_pg.39_\